MDRRWRSDVIESTIEALTAPTDDALSKAAAEGLVDYDEVITWAERARAVLVRRRDPSNLRAELDALAERLDRQLRDLPLGELDPRTVIERFVRRLPAVRALLAEDVEAAFEGDPAAKSFAEILMAYPAIQAIASHRIAHELHAQGVPMIPRIITEYAHQRTGIDIHPGATIGRRFFIDHGTGVVIGETAEIGDRVKLYQGVTLGALSTRQVEALRGRKRHPTIEDDVIIYSGATILGGETVIGRNTVIGGNVWLTHSVPPDSIVTLEAPSYRVRRRDRRSKDDSGQLHWDI